MNANIMTQSWNQFDDEYAKSYLHDGDFSLLRVLGNEIFARSEGKVPKILDVGCGNGRFYKELCTFKREFTYYGIDISKPLIDAANHSYSSNENFNVKLVSDALDDASLDCTYDFSVSIHVAELCSSIEKLFHVLSRTSEQSAVIWYEYPRWKFTELEIREYVNHYNASNEIKTPYLRNRYSIEYHDFLLKKNHLNVIMTHDVSPKYKLEIYRRSP